MPWIDSDVCWLHLINQGVSVNGTSATFEWRPSGPSRYNKTTSLRCLKDLIRIGENCEHTFSALIILIHFDYWPSITEGCWDSLFCRFLPIHLEWLISWRTQADSWALSNTKLQKTGKQKNKLHHYKQHYINLIIAIIMHVVE